MARAETEENGSFVDWSDKGTFCASIFATNALHGAFILLRVLWMYLSTCGSKRKRHDVLGNVAMMMLSWTVATAVFDALDIFATLWYDVETQASISSAVFSFFSLLYGLRQRKADLIELAKIGTPRIGIGGAVGEYLNARKERAKRRKKETVANQDDNADVETELTTTTTQRSPLAPQDEDNEHGEI